MAKKMTKSKPFKESSYTKKIREELSDTKTVKSLAKKLKRDRPKLIESVIKQQEKLEGSIKADKSLYRAERTFNQISNIGSRLLKERLLTKPTAKIKKIDPKRFIASGGRESLVKSGRTGYFHPEEIGESKWL
jgi:hypothetical protein